MIINFFKKSLNYIGVDKAIYYTSLSRILQSLSGIITVLLIAYLFSEEEQGYYYTFGSVLALQLFFELGLGAIITQFVAHEMSGCSINTSNQIEGDKDKISRLSSLLRFCVKWYLVVSFFLFIILVFIGLLFFNNFESDTSTVNWRTPWILLSFFASLNLLISPIMSFLQGLHKVKEMAYLLFIQRLVIIISVIIGLIFGFKLGICVINSSVAFITLLFLYLRSDYLKILKSIYRVKLTEKVSYKNEIFPFQWRIGVSWASGYLINYLFNPIIFALIGASVAGQFGMTMTIYKSITSLTISWTSTKIPLWSDFISKKMFQNLDLSFNKVLKNSTFVSLFLVISFLIFLIFLSYSNIGLSERFLPLNLVLLISITVPINNILNTLATQLRCHKKEPYVLQSFIIGILVTSSTFINSKFYDINSLVICYVVIVVFITLPWSLIIFKSNRRKYRL